METTIIIFPTQNKTYRVLAGVVVGNKVFEGSYGNAAFFAANLGRDLNWPVKMVPTKIGQALEAA